MNVGSFPSGAFIHYIPQNQREYIHYPNPSLITIGCWKAVIITRRTQPLIIFIVQLTLLSSFWRWHTTCFGVVLHEIKTEVNTFQTMVIATDSEGHHGPSLASSRILPCFVLE